MQARPNKTVVKGRILSIRPDPDGWGKELDLEVQENESPASEDDFLRPAIGSVMKLFSAEPREFHVNEIIRAEAVFNAGPTGGRAVLRSVLSP